MSDRHSHLHRGLEATLDPDFQARFGRLFPHAPAARFGADEPEEHANLAKLAAAMTSGFDEPKDGADTEESGVPALYTYFGQFIDHDLTFDPTASFQKIKDPDAVTDYRSAAFDLDNVYGRGPGDQPYMYADDGRTFLLGDPLTMGGAVGFSAHDLQRNGAGRALIGDPRNDENVIVSQLQGLFHRFHNRVAAERPQAPFAELQTIMRRHYQYVVINDFLPRLVAPEVLDALKTGGRYDAAKLQFFKPSVLPFMPVEFSVAAYRFGHSMVRPGYRLNDATLLPIFPIPVDEKPGFPEGLTGFRRMIGDWAIDWGRFIDIDERSYGTVVPPFPAPTDLRGQVHNFQRLQLAYRIDTALVDPLGRLPETVAGNRPFGLAHRNLLRGVQFKLPSGQTVAEAMGVSPPLRDDQILIGQGLDTPDGQKPITDISSSFAGKCPLWTYVLAEAMYHRSPTTTPTKEHHVVNTLQLGPVGGRIVAEVFVGLMLSDPFSLLSADPDWKPCDLADYGLKDFVRYALGL